MPKQIEAAVRDVILSVFCFNEKEKKNNGPLIPFENVIARTAAMTGVSVRTVYRVRAEAKELLPIEVPGLVPCPGASNNLGDRGPPLKQYRPAKQIHKKSKKLKVSNFDEINVYDIRRKLQEYYLSDTVPTLKKLHENLQRDINFKGSYGTLRNVLQGLGFDYKQTVKIENKDCDQDTQMTVELEPGIIAPPDTTTLVELQAAYERYREADTDEHTDGESAHSSDTEQAEDRAIRLLEQPVNVKIEIDDNYHNKEQDGKRKCALVP